MFKQTLLFILIIASSTAKTWAGEEKISFQLHLWQRLPGKIPTALGEPLKLHFELKQPTEAQTATLNRQTWAMDVPNLHARGEVMIVWRKPPIDSQLPEYFNVQLTVLEPFRVQCAMTPKVNREGLPSLVCAQLPADPNAEIQLGVTLIDSRIALP